MRKPREGADGYSIFLSVKAGACGLRGIVFDAALMELARLKVGDQVNVTVHEGGSIYLTPVKPSIGAGKAAASAKSIIAKNSELFRRLS